VVHLGGDTTTKLLKMPYYPHDKSQFQLAETQVREHEEGIRQLQEYLHLTGDEVDPEHKYSLKPWNTTYEHGQTLHRLPTDGVNLSNTLVIRRLSFILEELRGLRLELSQLARPSHSNSDRTFYVACGCLGVLVLMLFFK